MVGQLCKAHRHPEPPKLTPVSNKGRVIGRGSLKWDVVEASFQIHHANPLCLPELRPVPPCVIELVLVVSCPFIDRDNILAHLVGLPGLDAWD